MEKHLYELDMTFDWNAPAVRGRRSLLYRFYSQEDPDGSIWNTMRPIENRYVFDGEESYLRFAIWGVDVENYAEAYLHFRAIFVKPSDAPSWQTWESPYPDVLTRQLHEGVELDSSNLLFHFGPRALWALNGAGQVIVGTEGIHEPRFWESHLPPMRPGRYELLVVLQVQSGGRPKTYRFDPEMEVGDQDLPPDGWDY